jgi:molecular chaperone GrpE
MADRTHQGSGRGVPSGRSPREGRPAEAPDGRAPSGAVPVDPELEADLGAEFPFRGDQLEAELEQARTEAAQHLDTALRLQAEFDNYRKRVARERVDLTSRAAERVVEELLPVLDNLERAIDHTLEGGELDQLLKGVEMVHQQVVDVFTKEGVEIVDPFGEPFDPLVHQAVGTEEDVDVPDQTCVKVLQRGYLLGGRVVRPAMVIVSHGGPARKE